MKKITIYLRPDQHKFIKTLPNSSDFVRECIDVGAANLKRAYAERIISSYKALKVLEEKIKNETHRLESTEEELKKLEDKLVENRYYLEIVKAGAEGNFEIQQNGDFFYAVIKMPKETITLSKKYSDGEARESAIEKCKRKIEDGKNYVAWLERKKDVEIRFRDAVKTKIEDLEEKSCKVQQSIKP